MIRTWQLQQAKNRFSRVVENAVSSGPQVMTRRGEEVAIVISLTEYQKLVATRGSLPGFFRRSPLVGLDVDRTRDTTDAREGSVQ